MDKSALPEKKASRAKELFRKSFPNAALSAHRPPGRWRTRSRRLNGPRMATWSSTTTAFATGRDWTSSSSSSRWTSEEERRWGPASGGAGTSESKMCYSTNQSVFSRPDWYRWSHRSRQVVHDAVPLQAAWGGGGRDHRRRREDRRDRTARPPLQAHHHPAGTRAETEKSPYVAPLWVPEPCTNVKGLWCSVSVFILSQLTVYVSCWHHQTPCLIPTFRSLLCMTMMLPQAYSDFIISYVMNFRIKFVGTRSIKSQDFLFNISVKTRNENHLPLSKMICSFESKVVDLRKLCRSPPPSRSDNIAIKLNLLLMWGSLLAKKKHWLTLDLGGWILLILFTLDPF